MGKFRHDEFASAVPRIGPNAILQLQGILEMEQGAPTTGALFHLADVPVPPADSGMLPQDQVARLHRTVRLYLPDRAPGLMRAAGQAVGDYILANRIPRAAQWLIRALPGPLGARLLSAAIARHAWTFAGSGVFQVISHAPLTFEIAKNPVIAGEVSRAPLCHWHAAVFERLFQRLVWPDAMVHETCCCAGGAPACRFTLSRKTYT
jgi:divinyl protochlorophyllide a 8-vinyl-reductase